jgi:hypothetical protein
MALGLAALATTIAARSGETFAFPFSPWAKQPAGNPRIKNQMTDLEDRQNRRCTFLLTSMQ